MAEKGAKIKFVADTSQFNDSIKKANSEIKLMSAELKLSSKEMSRNGESVEALEKHQKLLERQMDASKEKKEALNQKLAKAIEYYGENSTEVNNLRIQLANTKTEEEKMGILIDSCNEKLEKQKAIEAELNSETKKLTDTIGEQEDKLSKLKQEYVEVSLKYGNTSDEAQRLAREIQDLSGELNENKTKFSQASDKADKLDKSLEKVENSAEDAEDGLSVMDVAMGNLVADGISSLISGCGELISSIGALSEETREYRELMNKMNTAFETAGHTTEQAKDVYEELYSVFADEGRAVEAAQQIANISKNQEDMTRMTEIATGTWARFGDSLAAESLMEAISASSKMASVQGTLADALDWGAVEGEMFGLTLKENIKFTEVSSKELEKMTKKQKEEYEARKKQYESIEDYNASIEEAASASELFTIKLEECATEEERLALILDTLDGMYTDYAKTYKETNKNIIASRKATSEYNDTLAEMGEELEPVNTKVTELKTSFMKELTPTLKKQVIPAFEDFVDDLEDSGAIEGFADIVGDLAEGALPVLADVLGFVANNFTEVTGAAMLTVGAIKTMSIISSTTMAIKGATTAMGAFNAVLSANPIGAVVVSLGLLVGGFALLGDSCETSHEKLLKEIEAFTILTEEEQALINKTIEAGEAFDELQMEIEETNGKIQSEMTYTKNLADELLSLADANGKVEESDRTRAQFILNELNEALGTEYKMVDGIIQNYKDLEKSVYDVIRAKTANALLEMKNEAYLLAVQEEEKALAGVGLAYDNWQAQIKETDRIKKESGLKIQDSYEKMLEAENQKDAFTAQLHANEMAREQEKIDAAEKAVGKKKKAYDDTLANLAGYIKTKEEYEAAAMLIEEGNYEDAINMLKNKGNAFFDYSDDVSQATRDAIDALYKEAVEMGLAAKEARYNFENGIGDYTQEMVDEAERGYKDALNKWVNAYTDAESVGKDLGDGLKDGLENKRSSLLTKAKTIVSGIISAMRKEADSHSPSRKTIAFGEDMGEGTEIGLDNKTDDVVRSAKKQVDEVMNVYRMDFTKPIATIGSLGELPVSRNASTALEQSINYSNFVSLASAIEDLAKRPVILKINDKTVAETTASANDNVSGLRNAFISRGLVLG